METVKRQFGIFRNVQTLIVMALFTALSIVFGKMLAVNLTPDFRISLENTPVILAGIAYGPLAGAVVGGLADLIGCLIVGYTINPLITAGAVTVGFISGLLGWLLLREDGGYSKISCILRCMTTVFTAHFLGSLFLKTLGLYVYFGSPFWATFAVRAGIYAVTAVVETGIVYILYTQKIIKKFAPRTRG